MPMIEDEVLQRFDALDLPLRNPSGFLRVVHTLYPEDVEGLPVRARSWAAAESAAYSLRLPSSVEKHGGDFERRTDLSVCLISAIDMIKVRRPNYDRPSSNAISLCRYCWRVGLHVSDRRGYTDRSLGVTHAYCGIHKPQAETIISGAKGSEVKVYRKVRNQKLIQKARKVAKYAERIEHWVIQRDARLARSQGAIRSWIAGDRIASRRADLWTQFVDLFFPYIAHSPKCTTARLSPSEAFLLLEYDNDYEGKESFHAIVQRDANMLASYVMPMMLRLDVWLEVQIMIDNNRKKDKDNKKTGFVRRPWPDKSVL